MKDVYAPPRDIKDLTECRFYHTMEIPGHGLVEGEWDLRGREHDYLGGVDLRDKRVLEMGTASGYLCFWMERQGAEVVAYDLSDEYGWDVVPYPQLNLRAVEDQRRAHIGMLNNGFWLAHKAFGSNARVVYGTVYDVPVEIGAVDVSIFGSILLHVRDPFGALLNAARLTRERIVVTEPVPAKAEGSAMHFQPDYRVRNPIETWWSLPPPLIAEFLGVLGFEESRVSYHKQRRNDGAQNDGAQNDGAENDLYTVVGERTQPFRPTGA